MPSAAVTGAAIAESLIVVQNEFHAAPVHRRPWRGPFEAERLRVVPQRQRVVAAPGLDEAAGERHRVDHDGERRPRQRDAVAEAAHAVRQLRRQAGVALAGERRVHLASEHGALQEERAEREGEQQDAERGRATLVELRADDREEDLGRQHAEVAAEQDRVAEIGDRLDEADRGTRWRGPGRISGSETSANTRQRSARSVCAASSMLGDTPSTTPISTRKAIGVNANTCATSTPCRP